MVRSGVTGRMVRSKVVTKGMLRKSLKQHDAATKELKFLGSINTGFATTTPSVTLISGVGQGDNVTDRDGFQINAMDLEMNVTASVGSTTKEDHVRLIVFRDTMNLGSAPASSDIMNANDPRAFVNIIPSLSHRFVVEFDEIITLVNTASNQTKFLKLKKNLNHLPITFTGTSSTNVFKNAFYYWICGGTATNDTAYTIYTRMRFYDS
jgi:hypothetical protein